MQEVAPLANDIYLLSAENAVDIRDAVARKLRESGTTILTFDDILDHVATYTDMPLDLLPYEPFKPYTAVVKDALDGYFTGKLPYTRLCVKCNCRQLMLKSD